jgi:hypothetical protein
VRKLWTARHPYHCTGGCYYTSEPCGQEYDSWAAFLSDWKESDEDYNLLFRWDWYEGEENEIEPGRARVELHYFMQRKGYPYTCRVDVTRADEPAVRAFLTKKWRHMQKLWAPFSKARP